MCTDGSACFRTLVGMHTKSGGRRIFKGATENKTLAAQGRGRQADVWPNSHAPVYLVVA